MNISFDPIASDCWFCYDTKHKAVFTVLNLFFLVVFIFKERLFLAMGNISKVGGVFYIYLSVGTM